MLDRLLQHLHYRHRVAVVRVVAREMTGTAAAAPPAGRAMRLLDADDFRALCSDPALDLPLDWALAALARGDVCVGAFDGAELAGYVWTALDRAPDQRGVWVEVPPCAVYRYKAFVRPAYRGHGLAPGLYHFHDGAFMAMGRRLSIGFIAAHNRASMAASHRSGSRVVGMVVMRAADHGPFRAWHSPGVRRLGLRFYRP